MEMGDEEEITPSIGNGTEHDNIKSPSSPIILESNMKCLENGNNDDCLGTSPTSVAVFDTKNPDGVTTAVASSKDKATTITTQPPITSLPEKLYLEDLDSDSESHDRIHHDPSSSSSTPSSHDDMDHGDGRILDDDANDEDERESPEEPTSNDDDDGSDNKKDDEQSQPQKQRPRPLFRLWKSMGHIRTSVNTFFCKQLIAYLEKQRDYRNQTKRITTTTITKDDDNNDHEDLRWRLRTRSLSERFTAGWQRYRTNRTIVTTPHDDDDESDDETKPFVPPPPLRLIVAVEPESPTILSRNPHVLTQHLKTQLHSHLPYHLRTHRWTRIFSVSRDGDAFPLFLSHVTGYDRTVVVVATTRGEVFGGFADSSWERPKDASGRSFYGIGQSFLFKVVTEEEEGEGGDDVDDDVADATAGDDGDESHTDDEATMETTNESQRLLSADDNDDDDSTATPQTNNDDTCPSSSKQKVIVYKWSGKNYFNQFSHNQEGRIAMGGGGGKDSSFAFCVEDYFARGSTGPCETFDSPPLTEDATFEILNFEVYGFSRNVGF